MPVAGSNSDLFEMRRLESLSNTIFGVAMTLLAYDLPRAGQFAGLPDWADLYHLYAGRLTGLMLSFIIAGVFWISHHRRLVRQPECGRGTVILNLFFLLSIILLPVINGLYSSYGMSSAVAVLYVCTSPRSRDSMHGCGGLRCVVAAPTSWLAPCSQCSYSCRERWLRPSRRATRLISGCWGSAASLCTGLSARRRRRARRDGTRHRRVHPGWS